MLEFSSAIKRTLLTRFIELILQAFDCHLQLTNLIGFRCPVRRCPAGSNSLISSTQSETGSNSSPISLRATMPRSFQGQNRQLFYLKLCTEIFKVTALTTTCFWLSFKSHQKNKIFKISACSFIQKAGSQSVATSAVMNFQK